MLLTLVSLRTVPLGTSITRVPLLLVLRHRAAPVLSPSLRFARGAWGCVGVSASLVAVREMAERSAQSPRIGWAFMFY